MATDNRRDSRSGPCQAFLKGMETIPHMREERVEPLLTNSLAPQTELGDEASIPLDIFSTQIVEESATFADHQQETTTAVVVVLVVAKMLGQVVDPLCEQSNLHLGRACVASVGTELFDDFSRCLHCA
jgi:hypothetical protein